VYLSCKQNKRLGLILFHPYYSYIVDHRYKFELMQIQVSCSVRIDDDPQQREVYELIRILSQNNSSSLMCMPLPLIISILLNNVYN